MPASEQNNLCAQVKQELTAMSDVGMFSAEELSRALAYVDAHQDEVTEVAETGGVSDAADLVLDLIRI